MPGAEQSGDRVVDQAAAGGGLEREIDRGRRAGRRAEREIHHARRAIDLVAGDRAIGDVEERDVLQWIDEVDEVVPTELAVGAEEQLAGFGILDKAPLLA